jgi:nucleoside-diphosphate-sugar epimerase
MSGATDSSKIKVIVTGASGLLGRAVLDKCKRDGYDGGCYLPT